MWLLSSLPCLVPVLVWAIWGSQIESVPSIKDKTLLNQISEVSLVSSMSYSDSKKIADIDTDLLRTPIESDAISNNVKNAIIATEDEKFQEA